MQYLCSFIAYYLSFMQKENRHNALLELISAESISRQDELTTLLEKKGFIVTQSSVSRDLDELGIVKINGIYALPQKNMQYGAAFGLNKLETAGESLIVAKCDAGLASAVCVRIDNEEIADVVGTIAGEDTIFIAVKDAKAQKAVIRKIWELFEK